MGLDGCGVVCINLLLLFNIIFTVAGSAFLGLGLWFRFNIKTRVFFEIASLKSWVFIMGVTVMIVLGSFVLITALLGFYGSCSKKRWALQMFSALLAALTTAGIVFGFHIFFYRYEVGMNIVEFYINMYILYNRVGPVIGVTVKFIHNMLYCCGLTGIQLIETTCPKPIGLSVHTIMPSCLYWISAFLYKILPFVSGFILASSFVLISALVCSVIVLRQINRVDIDVVP